MIFLGARVSSLAKHSASSPMMLSRPERLKNLRAGAAGAHAATTIRGLEPHVEALQSLVERLSSAEEGTLQQWQEGLERAAMPLREALDQHSGHLDTEVLSDAARHVQIIKHMIASAQRQIVIACPFVHYEATWQFREAIDQALRAGRTVFLLFGMVMRFPSNRVSLIGCTKTINWRAIFPPARQAGDASARVCPR